VKPNSPAEGGAELTNKVESQAAYGGVRLSLQQEDELYLQLADALS
jgi:tetratricopeptide (TPR) repeat protein